MARRTKESGAEVFVALMAKLPWWAAVAAALVSYVIFHALAVSPMPVMKPGQIGDAVPAMLVRGVSMFLQYVVPFLCVIGAIVSFIQRKKRVALVSTVTASRSADALNDMTWQEFELLVGEAFRLQGYQVAEHGGAAPDGGVDLLARKGNETFLVQCKQWRAMKVSVEVVRELYGVMAARGAAGGFVVTSGRFTDDAVAFANGRNLHLIDGPKLFALLQQTRASLAAKQHAPSPRSVTPPSAASAAEAPACPKCNASMVRRVAKKGSNAGSAFWGCSTFPACHGTRSGA